MLCFLETRPRLAGGHTPLILAIRLHQILKFHTVTTAALFKHDLRGEFDFARQEIEWARG